MLLNIRSLYPPALLEQILTIGGVYHGDLKPRVLGAAAWLNAELHYETRPTSREKHAGLDAVGKKTAALVAAFESLDADTKRLIEQAARGGLDEWDGKKEPHKHTWDPQTEPDPRRTSVDLGKLRYNKALDFVARLSDWIQKAGEHVEPAKRGRPSDDAISRAMESLVAGCREVGLEPTLQTKGGKTSGPYLDFVRDALDPVLRANGKQSDLERKLRDILYG